MERAPQRPQSFLLTGDRQRWVEERRGDEKGSGVGWCGVGGVRAAEGVTVRIMDDLFVRFAAKDFESIAASVAPSGTIASTCGKETSGQMWK